MKHEEATFHGWDGIELYYQRWQPDADTHGIFVIVHGVNEHSGRYLNLVYPLTLGGYAVYGYDQRGHGRSPGQRVHINQWADYREDLQTFLKIARSQEPGKPLFLYGHSMGALVALDFLLHYPQGLRGAVISGPPIEPAGVAKPHLVILARTLTHIWPRLPVNLGLDAKALSRDQEVVKAYETDPLVTRFASVRWGTESLDALAWVKAHQAEICLPILLIHGEADRLNLAQGSRDLYEAIPITDKTLRIYPGGYHEQHNDLDHRQLSTDIKDWLDQHID